MFLEMLQSSLGIYSVKLHGYVLMNNHFHLIVQTPKANLSQFMRQFNVSYTAFYNRRHKRVGHLYQGRFKAILVQKESHLLELGRYVVLNPVRARMVRRVEDWRWSSYRAVMARAPVPDWLDADGLLALFGKRRDRARHA